MPLDPSIITSLRPAQIQTPNPLDWVQGLARVEDVRAQVEQRRLAADAARQKAMDDAQVRSVFAATGGDVDQAIKQLYAVNPRAAAPLDEAVGKARKEQIEATKTGLEVKNKQLEISTNLAQMITDQPSHDFILPMIAAHSPDVAKLLGPTYDPQKKAQLNNMILSAKERNDAHLEAVKLWTDGKPQESLNTALASIDPKLPEAPAQWVQTLKTYGNMGAPPDIIASAGAFSPENHARVTRAAIGPTKEAELNKPQPITTTDAAGHEVTQFVTPTVGATYAKPDQHSPAYKEWQDYKAQGGQLDFNAYQTMDANRKAVRVNTGQGSAEDVKDAVQGMIDGRIPPMLPGRASTAYTAMMAEAQRRGYNLAGAATDWMATQAHIKTMNNAQQLGLNQSINALPGLLDSVDALATEWKGSGAPLLNRANLALAKNGAYGAKAATVANRLDTQIAETVADLGKVYMGSNSPTDHALGLAAKALQADWSESVLHDMVAQARDNVRIRRNSINNTGVAGASADNPYMPAPPPPTPAPAATPATNPFRK